ncbi:MAG: deoxyribonuclease IV [Buchnera aphidicola (Periphyllus lyropictus)]|uniref:deoxyribonuclease IV n=1 Tax=Buchnera aphidicola TaxID=9 RepID=UPI001EC0AADB|nr:deoxyribonuclease IV [Buchnera aphidicola]NIH16703.1 deoxyribonuclease IV [Buchnera aphidicola (Periphyllus lyropictus)]USS94610.1 deoxyribonuclease IV [Buchnera aphidicola (Periphyllus lyropictus)]
MKYIGPHVSISKGIVKSVKIAYQLNSTAIGFFLKNPLQWDISSISENVIRSFKNSCKKYKFTDDQIFPHSGFLINLGNYENSLLKKSRISLINEVKRCRELGIKFLNFHPGSHLNKISEKNCLKLISKSINFVLSKTKDVILVIENTAGQGTNMGYCFHHLYEIIKNIEDKTRIGVCLDTCHLFSSGYDIRNKENYKKTFDAFEEIVGFNYLKGLHLNDSKFGLGKKKDRHENLGFGYIGKNFFKWVIKDLRFKKKPLILETVNKRLWKKEISWLQSKIPT